VRTNELVGVVLLGKVKQAHHVDVGLLDTVAGGGLDLLGDVELAQGDQSRQPCVRLRL
jgi:hypothetical protein